MSGPLDRVRVHPSWKNALASEFSAAYMSRLRKFLVNEIGAGKTVYPPMSELFAALDLCPLDSVRAVIIGQDPYHGMGQAHGLCFSVKPGIEAPPSLVNIMKELYDDLMSQTAAAKMTKEQFVRSRTCLTGWAEQGVLLLNSVLTVLAGRAGTHQGQGWEEFTDRIVQIVNEQRQNVVFLLWGKHAQQKGEMVDRSRHCVLEAPHPSPLSAQHGFFGCRHFSRANEYLITYNKEPIDWFRMT